MSSSYFCLTLLLLFSPHLAMCLSGTSETPTTTPPDDERPHADAYVHGDVDFDPAPLTLGPIDQLNFEQNLQDAVETLKPLKAVPAQ